MGRWDKRIVPCCTMRVASPSVKVCAIMWRYRSIALLRHLPTRRIVSVSTRSMRRYMAPPGRIEHVLTSSGVNPTLVTMIVVAAQSVAVISALQTVDHLSPLKTAARCVSRGGSVFL